MLLTHGEKVHVMHRSFSEKPAGRTLVGMVELCEAGVARIRGRIYVVDPTTGKMKRQPEIVTRFISLVNGEHIVTPLPEEVVLDQLSYEQDTQGLRLKDDAKWGVHLSALSLQ